jgi:hypothetical protein
MFLALLIVLALFTGSILQKLSNLYFIFLMLSSLQRSFTWNQEAVYLYEVMLLGKYSLP